MREIIELNDSAFRLDLDYFMPLGSNQGMQIKPDGTVRLARHFSDRMVQLFGLPREPHAEITQRDMDLAYAMQHRFEEVFFHLLKQLHQRVPVRRSGHGWRLRAEQRRQRETFSANSVSADLDPAGGRR